ncbi:MULTISPECIES: FtsX-like permease family protein [Kitasatospora]|uniref:Putative membrane protein n=1 Tax=Kitasatospora setae (strain ATCC 33774 / DSM 43861 / JCM 3304 / KCC A-0304 / NBRC 14216 / KM-6054) TaxID=452652 RepID=E4NC32_KITSK|nr:MULTISPECIES: FtsX-like permease family protein [Kitasatospora]BAJ28763.1 putative membrane protein [Kitasatospora setae KM-6054]
MLLKTSLRSFFAHKWRLLLSLLAVVLSVAFVSGTLVFYNTATSTFDKLFASTASDLSVSKAKDGITDRGGPAEIPTVPAGTVAKVAAEPGVKAAIGQVMTSTATLVDPATNKVIGPTTGAPTLTGNWTDGPRNSVDITSGHAPQGADQVVLDADTAKKAKLGLGAKVRVITDANHDFTIAGIATFRTTNPGAALVFMDTPTAQQVLLGTGAYTSVEVFGDGTRTDEQLKAAALADLGGGFQARTADEQQQENASDVGSFLDFMKYAMLGFAVLAAGVGGFLIVNTFSMLVTQRTREIGLLRAIGGSRSQVNRSVLTEGLILGVLGSTLGLGAGLGLALGMIQLMRAAGMNLDASLDVTWTVPAAAYAVGVLVTLLAAFIPARRASRITPMAALLDHAAPVEPRANRIRTVLGALATALGAAALVLAARSTGSSGGALIGLGVLATLVGAVVLGPLLVSGLLGLLGGLLPALFGPAGRLAQRNVTRNPRRTGSTAAALMIGLAVVVGASVITSSMVTSAGAQIDKSVGADYIVGGGNGSIAQAAVDAVARTKGVDHVTRQKEVPADLTTPDGARTESQLIAADPSFARDFRLPLAAGTAEGVFTGGVSVDQKFADAHHLKVGDPITADYGDGRTQTLPVAAVLKTGNQLFDGNFFTAIDTVSTGLGGHLPGDRVLFAGAAAGADKATVLADLQKTLEAYPQLMVKDQAGYKDMIRSQVDKLLAMVYGLLGLTIVVAVLGVVNTLALSVVERTREIGLLRAIGLSRRQLRRVVRLESVVIALFGAVLGTGLGLAWGVTARSVLATQGLSTLSVPTGTVAAVLVGSVLIGLIAALVPAFRAARMNVLAAIATD